MLLDTVYRATKRCFTHEDQPIQALCLDRADEAFRVRVQVRCARQQSHRSRTRALQKHSERRTTLGIPINDEHSTPFEHIGVRIGDVARHLQQSGVTSVSI